MLETSNIHSSRRRLIFGVKKKSLTKRLNVVKKTSIQTIKRRQKPHKIWVIDLQLLPIIIPTTKLLIDLFALSSLLHPAAIATIPFSFRLLFQTNTPIMKPFDLALQCKKNISVYHHFISVGYKPIYTYIYIYKNKLTKKYVHQDCRMLPSPHSSLGCRNNTLVH